MKFNKKLFVYAGLPLATLGLIGASQASAHGMFGFGSQATPEQKAQVQTQIFQNQANLLGVSVDEVKNAWASGKGLKDLATEKGITEDQLKEKIKAQRESEIKQNLQDLVNQGVITQAQADQRLQFMQNNQNSFKGMRGRGMMMRGFGF